jgi:peptidoglycan/LPS O-acetylase OafA/YrhL
VQNRTHIDYLDSIRGLAALTVINEHFVIAYGLPCKNQSCQHLLDYSPLHIWWDGGAAVSMFFVLSGFVLSLKYFRTDSPSDMHSFRLIPYITGRIFRIWLPYGVILFISALLYQHTIETPLLKTELMPSDWIVNMWRNNPLTLMDKVRESFLLKLPPSIILLPQAWTLTIELALSLLLPVGLLLAERGTFWLIFFSLLSVCCLDISPFLLHFLSGLMIAHHYRLIVDYLTPRPWTRRGILLMGLYFYTSASTFPQSFGEIVISLAQGMGAGLIILYALSSIRTQGLLSNDILRQIGKVSYSAYLMHMAILICLTPYLLKGLESFTLNTIWLWPSGWLLTIIIVQLLSLVSYYGLEIPSIRLGRKLS